MGLAPFACSGHAFYGGVYAGHAQNPQGEPKAGLACPGAVSLPEPRFLARGRPGPPAPRCAALNRPGELDPFLLCSIPSFCARYLPGLPETAMAAVCTIPPPPQAPKGAVGLSVVQLDLGSSSFRHFVLLDDVCAALKRPVKSWSTGTLLYQLCVATNFHVDKARCAWKKVTIRRSAVTSVCLTRPP